FLPIATLQIQSAAFRFLIDVRNDSTERKRIISNIYFFLVPSSFFSLLILFFFLYKIEFLTRLLIVIYFFVDIIMMGTQQIIRGLSNNKLFSISAIIQSVVNMILIVLTISIAEQGLNGILISIIVATTISVFVLIVKGGVITEIDFRLISIDIIKQMLGYSWPMIPNTLSNWVLSMSDRLVLTVFIGIEAIAVYGVANKIPQLLGTIQGTFIFAWQENASLVVSDNDAEKYYSDMFDHIYCIVMGFLAVLIGAAPILFKVLIRGDYGDAYPQMSILFLGIFFNMISAFLGGIYVAHKRTKNVGITTMIAAICNLAIDLALVNYIGIYAASVSTVFSYLFLVIYRMHDIKKFQTMIYKYGKIAYTLAILLGMCVICWINLTLLNFFNFAIGFIFAIILNWNLIKTLWSRFIRKCSIMSTLP
ncbi:MAG: polysaccharide biosynthesis C-terminal domain-containing protein, partial [Lachnospiraceae bacterium]|nr:polysaccharide biosynthesis C-terminal domain-containing protein [Lachnospiraceae bacterium]